MPPLKLRVLRPVPAAPDPDLSAEEDDALMALVGLGRKDAFREVVDRHLHRLVTYCSKFTGSISTGEELAQDVFTRVWIQRERYRPQGQLRLFLLTVARNACRNRARSLFRFMRATRDPPPLSVADAPLEMLLQRERERRVRVEVAKLPQKLREAVLLRYDQELSYAEVGSVLGLPEATARTRVFHGLRRLRGALQGGEP